MTSYPLQCAVIGNPIAHSRSPEIHHAFAKQCGLALQYQRLLANDNDFSDHVRGFFAQGGRGLNVTVPFKEKAFALADVISPRAQQAGAINTLWMQDGQLHGCNTDGIGLVQDLIRLGFDPKQQRVLLIGAGGAARGVLLPLIEAGVKQLRVVNRTAAKAQQLICPLAQTTPVLEAGGLGDTQGTWDIVINATSSSLQARHPLDTPLSFSSRSLAYDMVYGPEPTPFMQSCLQQGASHCADGLGMLVAQAAESFAIWHGQRPDPTPVLTFLRQQLES